LYDSSDTPLPVSPVRAHQVNVYPRELEEVMLTHPAVSLVAVVGVPHDSHGEEVKAYVIRRRRGHRGRAGRMVQAEHGRLQAPRVVEFRDTLPMTATGKILKRELR